jgi:DNA-binding transcriptional LysR family regulator
MLDLNDFYYFVQIVDRGGFAAASQTLGVPKSTLSHRIQLLETNLGVRLINRSSRRFSTTNIGNEFYRHAVSMIQQAEAAERAVRQHLIEPSGTIRFTSSVPIAQFALKKILPQFIKDFPKVNVIQYATNDFVDIVAENYDLALRGHFSPLPDSTLVQRPLTPVPWLLFASPSYLDRSGTPRTPSELEGHDTLFVTRGNAPLQWDLRHAQKGHAVVPLTPKLSSNDMVVLKRSACDGLGLAALPEFICRSEVQTGRLIQVLPDWLAAKSTLTALMPFRRGILPSVRAFVDFIGVELPKMISL